MVQCYVHQEETVKTSKFFLSWLAYHIKLICVMLELLYTPSIPKIYIWIKKAERIFGMMKGIDFLKYLLYVLLSSADLYL